MSAYQPTVATAAMSRTRLRDRATQTDWDKVTTDGLIYLLAAIGFYLGYHTLHTLALAVGYTGNEAKAAAITADVAILAYSRKAVAEIKAGRSAWGIRLIVAAFSLATFGLQLRAAWPHPTAVGFHAMSPAVWVIGHEMMLRGRLRDAKAARRASLIAAGLLPAPLPSIRLTWWLLDPYHTLIIWRLVKLWEKAPADVIRIEAANLQKKGKDIPRSWEGYLAKHARHTICGPALYNPVVPPAPVVLYRASDDTQQVPADEVRTFISMLPEPPAKGRPKDKAMAFIRDVDALAAQYDIAVTDTFVGQLLQVDRTRVYRIREAMTP